MKAARIKNVGDLKKFLENFSNQDKIVIPRSMGQDFVYQAQEQYIKDKFNAQGQTFKGCYFTGPEDGEKTLYLS